MGSPDVVFLLDCDNTLLDNDRVLGDLREHIASEFGPGHCARYWKILDALREELGYVDYLGALQRYRLDDMSDDWATFDESESSSSLHSLSSSSLSFDMNVSEWDLSWDASSHSSLSSLSLFLDVSWRPSAFDIAEASDRDASALLGAPPQADSSAAEKHTTPIAIHRNCIGKTPVGRIR